MIYNVYKNLTNFLSIPILFFLFLRFIKKKESIKSIKQKFGSYRYKRPGEKLIWINAVSIGEALSVLSIIKKIRENYPLHTILITTTTLTSAKIIDQLNIKNVIHQFSPIDIYFVVKKFFNYWKPNLALFVESEIWPNLILESKKRNIKTLLLNARLSEKAFQNWKKVPNKIFKSFDMCITQDNLSKQRLKFLGIKNIKFSINMKFFSENLKYQPLEQKKLQLYIKNRFTVLLVSCHNKEEQILIDVIKKLKKNIPDIFSIILPRHISRSKKIQRLIKENNINFKIRSSNEIINESTDFYLADTIGETGLFYAISDLVIIGGSFINHGGQNPIEPSNFNCPIIFGPFMQNFQEITNEMLKNNAALKAMNKQDLKRYILMVYKDKLLRKKLSQNLTKYCKKKKEKFDFVWRELNKFILDI